jgi:hypothetical protein
VSYRPRHLAPRRDRRLAGWLVTIGVLLVSPGVGMAIAAVLVPRPV